jgi:hypothetical protein
MRRSAACPLERRHQAVRRIRSAMQGVATHPTSRLGLSAQRLHTLAAPLAAKYISSVNVSSCQRSPGARQIAVIIALTSSSRRLSRTRFCTTCCVALAPTRPPLPGPVIGSSGRLAFLGSIRSLSLFLLFVLMIPSDSTNIGDKPGVRIVGAASASDMSSTVTFLAGPLFISSLAPLVDACGEYSTTICPFDSPVTI